MNPRAFKFSANMGKGDTIIMACDTTTNKHVLCKSDDHKDQEMRSSKLF